MELGEAMLNRRSVRAFTDEQVSDENIETLMRYAMSGPSACNKKPWEFYVVKNEDKLKELAAATRFSGYKSPLIIVPCGNLHRALPLQLADFWIQDVSAATENILLGATDLKLGAVWCGVYPKKRTVKDVQTILSLPEHIVPLGFIHVGHPKENPEPRTQYDEKRVHLVL